MSVALSLVLTGSIGHLTMGKHISGTHLRDSRETQQLCLDQDSLRQ